MKRTFYFAKEKFILLPYANQIKNLIRFFYYLEQNWDNADVRINVIENIRSCLVAAVQSTSSPLFFDILKQLHSDMNERDFFALFAKVFPTEYHVLRDDHFLIKNTTVQPDGLRENKNKVPLVLILDNLRSTFNVGSIIRTAECAGVKEIYFCGSTPTPLHPKIKNTAMQTQEFISWQYSETTKEAIQECRKKGLPLFALEIAPQSVSLYEQVFPLSCALIVGNESLGIDETILQLVDNVIQIPLQGWKNSLNVGVCLAVTVFEIIRQWNTK